MEIAKWHLNEQALSKEEIDEYFATHTPTQAEIDEMMTGWADVEDEQSEVDYVQQFEDALLYGDGDLPW